MKIKVITFDFWNTLFDSSNGQIRNNERIAAIAEELSKLGIAADIELNPLLSKAMEYFNSEWINKQTTPDALQLIEFIWAELKIKKDLFAMGRLKTVFEEAVLYYPPALTDGVREALQALELGGGHRRVHGRRAGAGHLRYASDCLAGSEPGKAGSRIQGAGAVDFLLSGAAG